MSHRSQISYPLDQPIAVGRTAEIYAWGEGRVLKLTRPDFPAHLAEYNRAAPAPAAHQNAWIALQAAASLRQDNRQHMPPLALLIKAGLQY